MDIDAYCSGGVLEPGLEALLLVDGGTVEDCWGVRRVVTSPFKDPRNPLLMPDLPWEDAIAHPNVLYDGEAGVFRMWYTVCDWGAWVKQFREKNWVAERDGYPYFLAYAESVDGVTWVRPQLEGHGYKGYERTNVLVTGVEKAQAARVMWNVPSSGLPGRFLMSYKDNRGGHKGVLVLATSDDGIRWVEDPAGAVALGLRDTWQNMVFDPVRERWLMYTRPTVYAGRPGVAGGPTEENYKRRMAVMVGATPREFGKQRVVLWPEEVDEPDFDNFMVKREGSHYVCFVGAMGVRPEMAFSAHLAFSSDGLRWGMLPERPVYLEHGERDSFDAGSVFDLGGFVEVGNRSYIYYRGSRHGQSQGNRNNQTGIGRAEHLRHRYVAQMGGSEGGFLLTRELVVGGPVLWVNLTVASGREGDAVGALVAPEFACEVVRFQAGSSMPETVPGYSLEECTASARDLVAMRVGWREHVDMSELVGERVFLRFYLKNCGLYTVQFGEG